MTKTKKFLTSSSAGVNSSDTRFMETKLSIKPAPRVQTKRKKSRDIAGAVLEKGVLNKRLKKELFVDN